MYAALGSYLMNLGDSLPVAALVLGWSAMAFDLFVLGVALENRPWALKMELLRLASNLPLVWLAPLVGLWPASALGWVGLISDSLLSGIALYCCRGRLTRLAS
ncbi:C-5 sterol desaturase [Pseudomonas chlororaphis]|nr:C-5 sterol desaturase [Pseudomonas chlororaphis]